MVYRTTNLNPLEWSYEQGLIAPITHDNSNYLREPFSTDLVARFTPTTVLGPYAADDRFFVKIDVWYADGNILTGDHWGTFESDRFTKGEIPTEDYPNPTVRILSPTASQRFTAGSSVRFRSEITMASGATFTPGNVIWTSSRAGCFGTGTDFTYADLGSGLQEISCQVTDSRGKTGSARVSIDISGASSNEDPDLTLQTPSGVSSGRVRVSYDVTYREGDASDWVVRYDATGSGTWRFASVVESSAGSLVPYGSGGKKIAGVPPGSRSFVWDTGVDLPSHQGSIRLRMAYVRPNGVEPWHGVISFLIDNATNEPRCQVTPSPLDFGAVTPGETKDLPFSIKNTGGGILTGNVTENCSVFSIPSGIGDYSLAANQERTVTVRFSPTSAGSQACAINLGGSVCGSLSCTGSGVDDPQPPRVEITSPQPGSRVSGIVRIQASASDNVGVTRVEFMVFVRGEGYRLIETDRVAPYEIQWDTRLFTDGGHGIKATAYDAAENDKQDAIGVTVDNGTGDAISPQVTITRPSSGSVLTGIVTLAATASDNVSVDRVSFLYVGPEGEQFIADDNTAPYEITWDSSTVPDGPYGVEAIVDDTSDNTSHHLISVTVSNHGPGDIIPPAPVSDLVAGDPSSGSLRLTWTAVGDDGLSGTASQYDLRYSLQPITLANWVSALPASGLSNPLAQGQGEHFTVTGLQPSTLYYFRLNVGDEVPNWSGLSNESSGTTSEPGPVEPGFVLVSAGTFTMGSPTNEPGRFSNETQHQVTLTKALWVSTYEVTQSEWQAVMGWNESSFPGNGKPVEQVTWYDAVSYCNQRSSRDGYSPAYTITGVTQSGNHVTAATVIWSQAANGYRLLTEAEWEYACRATSTTAFCSGGITNTSCSPLDPNLDLVGWYCGNASSTTHDCGSKTANAWGLKDMHGTVWEWCWDWDGHYAGDSTDPLGPPSGSGRVFRGGGARSCRSARRSYSYPINRNLVIGLRLARTSP